MPPGVVSRECQFGLHRAFSNEVELFALVPIRVDCLSWCFQQFPHAKLRLHLRPITVVVVTMAK